MKIRNAAMAGSIAIAAAAVAAGCGGDVGTPGGGTPDAEPEPTDLEGLSSIAIEPAGATLIIDGDDPATATFTATGTFEDGRTEDITEHASFSLRDSAIGTFSGSELVTGIHRGGATRVTARAGNVQGGTDLTVIIRKRYGDPEAELPTDPEGAFDGAPDDASKSPEIVYPAPSVLVPPNLERLEIHLVPSGGAEVFELSFASATTDVIVYTSCTQPHNGGCIYLPEPAVWRWIAQSNRGTSVSMTARAIDAAGSGVGASEAQDLAFSHDDIRGAIYYWTTSDIIEGGSPTAIMRYDFASDQQEAEVFIEPTQTDGNCVGCHALSPDGSKMFTAAGGDGGQVLLTDVQSGDPMVSFDSTPRSAFGSWDPDGDYYVGTYSLEDQDESGPGWLSYDLNFFDGDTGEFLETVDVGGTRDQPISQPDWSPDGERIVFIKMGEMNRTHAFALRASIGLIERVGGGWSEPVFLTEHDERENTFFPAFSPESDLIAFNRSTCPPADDPDYDPEDKENSPCNAHGDDDATLFVMEPSQDAEPVELARANAPGVLDEADVVMNSFPKWTPFTFQRTEEFGSKLHWISFASDRRYGLREPGADFDTLIWVAGVDPDAAKSGNDPSTPAFALPFQELDTDNHTAQWTETAIIVE
jgi:hypothetical protein